MRSQDVQCSMKVSNKFKRYLPIARHLEGKGDGLVLV